MANQPTVQDQINIIKKAHQDALLKKNTCETQLQIAQSNLANVREQIEARNLTPEQLPDKLAELQATIQEKLREAAALLPAQV